jgi:hypothetical protein
MGAFSKTHRMVSGVGNWIWLLGPGGVLWAVLSWVSSHFAPVANYGWAADVLAGIVFASLPMGMTGALLAGWRYFNPLPSDKIGVIGTEVGQVSSPFSISPLTKNEPKVPAWLAEKGKEWVSRQPKQLTPRTASELLAYYRNMSGLQASQIIKQHVGLWIKLTAQIFKIYDGGIEVIVALRERDTPIECRFSKEWESHFLRLNEGDTITVIGKINNNQNGSQLYLVACEIPDV